MLATVISISNLLMGISILLIGSGFLGTLLGVRAGLEGFSGTVIGIVMSSYFVGFVLGAFICPNIIRRVGHIRAFAIMAAAACASSLGHGLIIDPVAWVVLRIITGISVLGLYLVTESWLNDQAPSHSRGRLFATYMSVTLVALAVSQFLLLVYGADGEAPFILAGIFLSLALIPVAMTRRPEPTPVPVPTVGVAHLFQVSPSGVVGATASGLVNGAFWGVGAVFAHDVGLSSLNISLFMSATILGGALLQFPIGHLSDFRDRRLVVMVVCGLSAVAALAVFLAAHAAPWLLILCGAVYGGFSFSVYALSVAHTNDHLNAGEALEATQGLLLMNGIGASVGPVTVGLLMESFGAEALPLFFAVVLGGLGFYTLHRSRVAPAVPAEEQVEFVPMARTSPVALEMDPRAETEPELELEVPEG